MTEVQRRFLSLCHAAWLCPQPWELPAVGGVSGCSREACGWPIGRKQPDMIGCQTGGCEQRFPPRSGEHQWAAEGDLMRLRCTPASLVSFDWSSQRGKAEGRRIILSFYTFQEKNFKVSFSICSLSPACEDKVLYNNVTLVPLYAKLLNVQKWHKSKCVIKPLFIPKRSARQHA